MVYVVAMYKYQRNVLEYRIYIYIYNFIKNSIAIYQLMTASFIILRIVPVHAYATQKGSHSGIHSNFKVCTQDVY